MSEAMSMGKGLLIGMAFALARGAAALEEVDRGAPAVPDAESADFSARAYSLKTGELLYLEHHAEEWAAGELVRHQVGYYDPNGDRIASKTLTYDEPIAPSFVLFDERQGFREGARRRGDQIELFHDRGELKSSRVEAGSDIVVDAGFHRLIQSRLDDLAAGDRLEFRFAVPSLGRFLRFEVLPERSGVSRSPDPNDTLELVLRPANLVLRALIDPVRITYAADGRLMEWEGLSNLRDPSGRMYQARIVFDYPAVETASVRSGELGR